MSARFSRFARSASIALISSGTLLASAPLPAFAVSCGDGQIVNGGFETPVIDNLVADDIYYLESWMDEPHLVWDIWNTPRFFAMVNSLPTVDTATSRAMAWSATEGAVELQQHVDDASDYPNSGDQWAEIAGEDLNNTLYQSVATVPGTVMTWTLAHKGLLGVDVMQVEIGATVDSLIPQEATPETGTGDDNPVHITDDTTWRTWTGTYTVPPGQTSTVFGFHGISTSTGYDNMGNLIDDIGFTCDADLTAQASGANGGSSGALAETGLESNFVATWLGVGFALVSAAAVLMFVRRRFRG